MYDVIIIGSGLSSMCFLDTLKKENKNIAIISFKSSPEQSLKSYNIDYYFKKKNLPPKFIIDQTKNLNSLKGFFLKNKIFFDNRLSIFGLLDEGGASNYWGGSCQFPKLDDINFLNKKNKDILLNCFDNIYKKYNFTGLYNSDKDNLNNKNTLLDVNFNKMISSCSNEQIRYYENCRAMDFTNNKIFTPKNYSHVINKNIKQLNYLVKKISKQNNIYKIYCEYNNQEIILKTNKLIMAAGTLATTKLVCSMVNHKNDLDLDHNPMLFGAFLSKNDILSDNFFPSQLAAEINLKKDGCNSTANFRSSNKAIKKKILDNYFFMDNFVMKKLYDIIDKKILFVNLYIDSKYGCLRIVIDDHNKFKITLKSNNVKLASTELNKSFNAIYKSLRKNNVIYPLKYSYVPDIGNDNHYTGTIPINGKSILSLNENSELNNYDGLYVIDGSAIPRNNLKFPTGLIMANASRVGMLI